MFYYAHSILLVLLLLLTSHIHDSLGSSEYLPWPNADKIIKLMCPASDICKVKATAGRPSDSCCSDCRCGEECVNGIKCCFRNNTKESYETCLYLSSRFNNFYAFTPIEKNAVSYYVVTQSPYKGCHKNRGMCDYSDTSTIYPGYSKTAKKIYFNKECATCHGVDDFEEATAYFFCDELGSSQTINFDEELSKYLDGDKSAKCFFSFEIRPFSTISHLECSIHSTGSIETLINITNLDHLSSFYSMSIDDMASACISSFYSPTFSESKQKLYPNPFCYLLGEGNHKTEQCYQSSANPSGIHFFVLINAEVKDVFRLEVNRKTQHFEPACVKATGKLPSNQYERCRPVICPVGHIFNKNGVCSFFGRRIFDKGRMNIYLNIILSRKENAYVSDTKLLNQSIDNMESYLQLPEDWRIVFWGISADTQNERLKTTGDIILILNLITADLPKGIESIKRHLNRKRKVDILNETYEVLIYRQKLQFKEKLPDDVLANIQCSKNKHINEYLKFEPNESAGLNMSEKQNVNECHLTVENVDETSHIEDDDSNCWKMVAFSVFRYNALSVEPLSKLYFCNLVQLLTDEYCLLANESLLFNKVKDVYLYDNEFLVQHHENGERIVKVCLDDSGLSQQGASASFKYNSTNIIIFLSVIILNYKICNL